MDRVTMDLEGENTHYKRIRTRHQQKQERNRQLLRKLQEEIDRIPKEQKILIMGDLNVRIGDEIIDRIKQRYNESHTNSNGDILVEFCAQNKMRINNPYFNHKLQQNNMGK